MITEQEIYLTDPAAKAEVVEFLKGFELTFTGNIDYTMGLLMTESSSAPVLSADVSCAISPFPRTISTRD